MVHTTFACSGKVERKEKTSLLTFKWWVNLSNATTGQSLETCNGGLWTAGNCGYAQTYIFVTPDGTLLLHSWWEAMLTLSYQRSTVVLKRKCSTFEKGNALSTMFGFLLPREAQQCIVSALIVSPLLFGPPDIPMWNKQLQRLHSELIGMKKRSVPWCQHEHINTAATPSQPATVKVMLTMWFQSMEFKG